MKLIEFLKRLEKIAPVSLSDDFCKKYGMYDNSGIIINSEETVNGALFSLDLSLEAVRKARLCGYNLIVTHHPAIYGGISRISSADPVAQCLKSGISVISMHLNFDVAPEGIDYHLMRGLGGKDAKILAVVENGGYGRVYGISRAEFKDYIESIKKEFSTDKIIGYGDEEREVKKVASFCGAGCDEKAISFAVSNGADVFVSSDMKHHEICALLERGVNVIHLTHYSAENYGFNKIYLKIRKDLSVPSDYFADGNLL